ncbi:MAG: hypothetical protein ACREQ4_08155, partial [Candidatus Binataceae bacterium]
MMRNLCKVAVVAIVLFGFTWVASAQWLPAPLNQGQGLPYDWTSRHVVYSSNGANQGVVQEQPRYWIQQMLRHRGEVEAASVNGDRAQLDSFFAGRKFKKKHFPKLKKRHVVKVKRDWNTSMGNAVYDLASPTYPAAFVANSSTPSCTNDFVVFTLPTGGSTYPGNFNIIAFNNLYGGPSSTNPLCSKAPQALFAYNASTNGGTLNGSPVLSLDGTEIAFVENSPAGSVFHVLRWKAGDLNNTEANFPDASNGAKMPTCLSNVLPCEYSLPLPNSGAASLSSPFVDYSDDIAYVSADNGQVYSIQPVFNTGHGQPVLVWNRQIGGSNDVMTPPIFDATSQNVFVGDASTGTAYYVRANGFSKGTCANAGPPPCVGSTTYLFPGDNPQMDEAPIVDSNSEHVFFFGRGHPSGDEVANPKDGSYLVQLDPILSNGSVQLASLGAGADNPIRPGSFNNNYFATGPAAGLIYTCGYDTNNSPQLYAFGFDSSGAMLTTPVSGSPFSLSNGNDKPALCSPVSENYVGGIDRIFLGASDFCVGSSGNHGCALSYDVTAG